MLFGQSIGLVEKLLRLRIVPLALAKLAQRAESLSQLGVRRTKDFSAGTHQARLEIGLCLLQLTRLQTQSTEGKQRPVQAHVVGPVSAFREWRTLRVCRDSARLRSPR